MKIENIQQNLTERFDAPLKDFYERRIIFWQDPEGEFSAFVDELSLPNAKIVKLTGNNNFAVKKLLLADDPKSNYLVYNPIVYQDVKDDYFLDIEGYSEEFRADFLSMRLDVLGAAQTPAMRHAVKDYAKFFENKTRVDKLLSLHSTYQTPTQLHIDILSVLTGARENTADSVIRAVLISGFSDNAAIENVRKFGNYEILHKLVYQKSGVSLGEQTGVKELAFHILLTALTMTYHEKLPPKAAAYVNEGNLNFCYIFVGDWAHSEDDDALYEIARETERTFDLETMFGKASLSALLTSEYFPCINECVLQKCMARISEETISVQEITDAVEKRRTSKWYKRLRHYYACILQLAKMQEFYQNNVGAFHIAQPQELFRAYTDHFYRMDEYYRLFHLSFGKALKESVTSLEDALKNTADYAEKLYVGWFLQTLGDQWGKVASEEYEQNGYLSAIPSQEKFYDRFVSPVVRQGNRAYVVISDALRYEIACELKEKLVGETKGVADISALQGVFPSATEFGMAALLPHRKLSYENEKVLCDGMATDGTVNREKILKNCNPNSVAVTYKDLLRMKQAERRELVRNAEVVYIYHNSIDAVAEKKATEDDVFEAAEEAILEIKNLVRMITNELSGSNIFITADHGFLYSYQPLREFDKAEKELGLVGVRKQDRRFVLADRTSESEYLLRLPLHSFETDLVGFSPKGYMRLKMQGGGLNFVHGGIALQEIAVPVVEFKNMRTTAKKFVETQKAEITLLSANRKISNSLFSLDFYQREAVEGKVVAGTYFVYMADELGDIVSDKQKLIADKIGQEAVDRQFRLRFNLKGKEYDKTKSYYLTVEDADTKEIKAKTEFTIDIAFTDDFDDF